MSSSRFEVFALDLIPQRLDMSCWYACARMLLNWKENKKNQSSAMVPPELDAQSRKIFDANSGIQNPQIIAMAMRLGLSAVPPMSVTSETIGKWLRQFGPLWVNGKTHIVVIGGVDGEKLKVFDPAPMNVGSIGWRSMSGWYEGNASVSSRDIGAGVQTVFLHC